MKSKVFFFLYTALTYSGNEINLSHKDNQQVRRGCPESNLCDGFDCGKGNCKVINGFPECQCSAAGYKGPECVDICIKNPCNTGKCVRTASALSGYTCKCPDGFTGMFCLIFDGF